MRRDSALRRAGVVIAALGLLAASPAPALAAGSSSPSRLLDISGYRGRVVTVAAGTIVELRLLELRPPAPGATVTWAAASGNDAVLHLVSQRHVPATPPVAGHDDFVADFVARAAGGAPITVADTGNQGTGVCVGLIAASCIHYQIAVATGTTVVSGQHVLLQAADAGRTVVVRRGTSVEVDLQEQFAFFGGPWLFRWSGQTSNAGVLPLVSEDIPNLLNPPPPPTSGVVQATYRAVFTARTPGRARIGEVSSAACEVAPPPQDPEYCLGPVLTFQVTVTP